MDGWRGEKVEGKNFFLLVEWEELMVWNWLFLVMVKRGWGMFGRAREGGLCVYI